jgi:hypothetical protein
MSIVTIDLVAFPGFTPYPRYGRIVAFEDSNVRVTDVHCGDPRCLAEHKHGDQVWSLAELQAAQAYQPQAEWELGRKSAPNAAALL